MLLEERVTIPSAMDVAGIRLPGLLNRHGLDSAAREALVAGQKALVESGSHARLPEFVVLRSLPPLQHGPGVTIPLRLLQGTAHAEHALLDADLELAATPDRRGTVIRLAGSWSPEHGTALDASQRALHLATGHVVLRTLLEGIAEALANVADIADFS